MMAAIITVWFRHKSKMTDCVLKYKSYFPELKIADLNIFICFTPPEQMFKLMALT